MPCRSRFHSHYKHILLLQLAIAILPRLVAQLPAAASNETSLISKLKDVQKAYHVLHRIDDQEEQLHLYVADDDPDEIHPFLRQCIKTCEGLKGQTYGNKTLGIHMHDYLDLTIKNYQALNKPTAGQKEYRKEMELHNSQRRDLTGFLVTAYALGHFVHLSEEAYWKTIDKKNYIRSNRYSAYLKLRGSNIQKAVNLLDSIYGISTDFQERTIYQLEAADQYEKNSKILSNGSDLAIKKYLSIISKKQYCLYLFEAWLKWRVVSQQSSGLSKSSDIPNGRYDEVRDQVANVILAHIQQNEKDEMAINQFFVVMTHDIIFRFGNYPYGNQNTVEYHEIFDK